MALLGSIFRISIDGLIDVLRYAVAAPLLLLLVYLLQNEIGRYQSRIKYLPGPRGWPVVGNLFQVQHSLSSKNSNSYSS